MLMESCKVVSGNTKVVIHRAKVLFQVQFQGALANPKFSI